jgi:hypothetical protein
LSFLLYQLVQFSNTFTPEISGFNTLLLQLMVDYLGEAIERIS